MDRKGQVEMGIGIGSFLLVFITIIVGVTLFLASTQIVEGIRNTYSYNSSAGVDAAYTVPADGITIDLYGQELIGTPLAINNTDGDDGLIGVGNYTIDEGISATSGLKTIRYTAIGSEFDGSDLNLSYDYGPDGYLDDSGARSVAGLIAIFAALAVAIVALTPTLRSGIIQTMTS